MSEPIKIIECPRDAMQGLQQFIPTVLKSQYISKLLKVGFDTVDFGSFVSRKAIPQMADTAQVLEQLDLTTTSTKLLAIVANARGAEEASQHQKITYLGFPLSISETFQQRNTNKSIPQALNELEEIRNICSRSGKKLVTYISMGFGNPYGDPYEVDLVTQFVDIVITLGSDVISLADTIGAAESSAVKTLCHAMTTQFPQAEIGVHLHSTPSTARSKIQAAYQGGCRRFDGAMKGYGGCPMAKEELVGNIPTETIVSFLESEGVPAGVDQSFFLEALAFADTVFADNAPLTGATG